MGKLVRFNVGDGDFQRGFYVTLQIFEEGKPGPIAETEGRLPPAKEVTERYDSWRKSHRKKVRGRSSTRITVKGSTEKETLAEIKKAKEQLHLSVNKWLDPHQSDFSPIWTEILKNMRDEDEEIRVIVKTKNKELQQLPWCIWDEFFDHYRRAEVCLYLPVTTKKLANPRDQVKVLAVLGKQETIGTNTRIEIEEDWKTLQQQLSQESNAELIRLPEPTLEKLCHRIDGEQWRCLFFAGHSSSEEDGTGGQIELNDKESITIDDLKYALRNAVDRGLQLVILNSCDGLGIARQLANLHIPNIIVMREPVPDEVAQKFLQHFLEAFAAGEPLHIAVRKAREKINYLERKFPGAIWLPTLFQNPAEAPLTWQSLGGVEVQRQSNQAVQPGEGSEAVEESSIVWLRTMVNNLSQGKQKIAALMVNNLSKSKQQQRARIGSSKMMPRGILFYAIVVTIIPVLTELWLQDRIKRAVDATRRTEKLFTAEQSYQKIVFLCSSDLEGIPTTMAKTNHRGFVPIIKWTSSIFPNPQKTCEEVSAIFQKYHETDQLHYLTTVNINGKAAICISTSPSNLCKGALFYIPPGHNPEEILKQLMSVRDVNERPVNVH